MRKSRIDVSEREVAEAKHAEAAAAHERAIAAFKAANAEAIAAEEKYEACSTEELSEARERRDEAKKKLAQIIDENAHGRAGRQVAIAAAHLAKVVEQEKRARLDELRPRLAAFPAVVEQLAVEWVEHDRATYGLAEKTIQAKDAHASVYAEAKALADDLGLIVADLGPAPSALELALFVRKSVSAARREDGQDERGDIVVQYLSDVPADWRTRDMSLADQVQLERVAERNRAIGRDAELARAHAAGVEAGRKTPEPKTSKELS